MNASNASLDLSIRESVASYCWHLCKGRRYYRRWVYLDGGRQRGEMLHEFVFRAAHGYAPLPPLSIDHIDCDPMNNCAANLRPATPRLQALNKRTRPGRDVPRGVFRKADRFRNRPYKATLKEFGRAVHLGYFATSEEASAVYEAALAREIAAEEAKSWELFRKQKEDRHG
jgi:hypothetical protein